jgi:glycosyltransferase involved in cell wall biosynthesis
MRIVHLTSSRFFGGPERQMLGLARHLPSECRTLFLTFAEDGRCHEFLKHIRWNGFEGDVVGFDTPNLPGATWDVSRRLTRFSADVLVCHGYKANMVGRLAARSCGIPAVAVARGWTGESWKVRLYEAADRLHLRYMDRVVCVSHAQAVKVRRAGVPPAKIVVIPNAARLNIALPADVEARDQLESFVADGADWLVIAAGRLSREKGFSILIDAARLVLDRLPSARFIVFGEGALRPALERQIAVAGLTHHFALPGHRSDFDQLLASADLFVLPSLTEGLPNVVLEASSAGVPVIATAVGGNPEIIVDGVTGRLVPPNDSQALANQIVHLLTDEAGRRRMGQAAREYVTRRFSFARQAEMYLTLFRELRQPVGAVA